MAASGLPSGRTSYRTYADYLSDMDQLAGDYPSLTRPLTLPNKTVLGEDIRGIEVTVDADNVKDGKPVFLLMGAHHAREWPSAEHTIEFAFDLLQSYAGRRRAGSRPAVALARSSWCRSSTSTASRSRAAPRRSATSPPSTTR